jgi:hypothetical protein
MGAVHYQGSQLGRIVCYCCGNEHEPDEPQFEFIPVVFGPRRKPSETEELMNKIWSSHIIEQLEAESRLLKILDKEKND